MINPDDLIKSATGGVVGFMLAQFVNLVALAWKRWRRPVLVIEPASDNATIVSDSVHYANLPEMLDRRVYGFYVKNAGRSVAKDVQFQITRIATRRREDTEYTPVSESSHQLGIYTGADNAPGAKTVTLAPKSAALVRLGSWREDADVIWPAISEQIDYHEEANSDAVDWRFTVITFDEGGTYTTADIDITFRKNR